MIFRIDGGDGDQDYFSNPFLAESVQETWFDGRLPRGDAILLRAVSGKFSGSYLAITSRTDKSLEWQMENGNWISVVLHKVTKIGSDYQKDLESVQAVGMAAIEILS
jgi:hypothetical protein